MPQTNEQMLSELEQKAGVMNPGIARILQALNKKFKDRKSGIMGMAIQDYGCFMWYGEADYGESLDWNETFGGDRYHWNFTEDRLYSQTDKTIKFLHNLLCTPTAESE